MDQFYISYIFMAISVIVSLKGFNDRGFFEKYNYSPYYVKRYREYYRVISHQFLHVDPMHLIFNMIALYYFGRVVEVYFRGDFGFAVGTVMYIVFYLAGGLFATIIPYFRNQNNELYRSVGASGAISAVIFAAIIFEPGATITMMFLPIPIKAWVFGPIYLLLEFLLDRYGKSHVAHDAHIGGALFGILFVLITNIERVNYFFSYIFS